MQTWLSARDQTWRDQVQVVALDPSAPFRLAGLYALERLAQDNPSQRETIVNVICAYLQMPYTPPGATPVERSAGDGRFSDGTAAKDENRAEQERERYEKRLQEHEKRAQEQRVRATAQRILLRHISRSAEITWVSHDLDRMAGLACTNAAPGVHPEGATQEGS